MSTSGGSSRRSGSGRISKQAQIESSGDGSVKKVTRSSLAASLEKTASPRNQNAVSPKRPTRGSSKESDLHLIDDSANASEKSLPHSNSKVKSSKSTSDKGPDNVGLISSKEIITQSQQEQKCSNEKKASSRKSPVRSAKSVESKEMKATGKQDKSLGLDAKAGLESVEIPGLSDTPPVKAEVTSTVRRSSRAPVPSSRFKDMELATGQRKRSIASEGTDTESDSEPSKKKVKTNRKSQKSPRHITEEEQQKIEIDAEQPTIEVSLDGKAVDSTVLSTTGEKQQELESENSSVKVSLEPPIDTNSVQGSEGEHGTLKYASQVETENAKEVQVEQAVVEEVVVEMGEEVVQSLEVSTTKAAEPATSGKPQSLLEQHLHSLGPPGKVNFSGVPVVESSTVSQPSQDVSSSAMEGSYALIEEKDLVTVQNAMARTPGHQDSSEDFLSKDIQQVLSGLKGFESSNKHITFTESNGQTVAIITISPPSNRGETSAETVTVQSIGTPVVQETYGTGSPQAADNRSQQHGYIVKETKVQNVQQPFATVMTGNGTSYVNLSVEPTSISNILAKSPQVSKPGKDFGGRVLKPESSLSSVFKTTLPASPAPVSILSQGTPIKAPSQTGQVYSLLTPKLPGGKTEPNLLTKSPQKPVILRGSISKEPSVPSLSGQNVVIVGKPSTPAIDTSTLDGALQSSLSVDTISTVSQKTPSVIMVDATGGSPSPSMIETPGGKSLVQVTNTAHAAASRSNNENVIIPSPAGKISTLPLPKGASSSLLQKLKEQPGRVIIKESPNTSKLVQASYKAPLSGSNQVLKSDQSTTKETVTETSAGSIEVQTSLESSADHAYTGLSSLSEGDVVLFKKSNEEEPVKTEEESVSTEQCHKTAEVDTPAEEKVVSEDSSSRAGSQQIVSGIINEVLEKIFTDRETGEPSQISSNTQLESTPAEAVSSMDALLQPNFGKIRIVDNGVEYEVKIVPDDVAEEELAATRKEEKSLSKENEENTETAIEVKQEMLDGEVQSVEEVSDINLQSLIEGKQSSGTQTAYTLKSGETVKKQVFTAPDGPIHKLSTVVNEDGQKRQYYYVSVVLNKDFDGKLKTSSQRSNSAPCVVSDDGLYRCAKCNYKTDRKANFYKHRRLHTGSKPHTCPVCNYKAGTSSNLKRHMGIHEDIRQHKCEVCGLCFRQKIHLERHIKYKHEEKRVKCPLCNYVCANEQPDLRMHMKRKHYSETSGEICVCPTCKATFNSKKDLKQHMKFHKDGPELKLFCKECSFVTDCQSRLKRHAAIHEKVKPFMCSICQYRAAQKEHVLRHLRTQHKIEVKRENKRPWKRRSGLEKPAEKVNGGEVVKEKADFSSGDKIFACNHCTMRFAKLINLYKHLHTQHSDIMPPETEGNYYCVVCEFFTHTKKALLIHMRRHNITDQTPPTHVFSCVLCRYVTPRRRNLFQHMRKKHNIDISQQVEMEGEEEEEEAGTSTTVVESHESLAIPGDIKPVLTTEIGADGQQTVVATAVTVGGDKADGSVKIVGDDLAGVANMIKIEDLTRVSSMGGEVDPNKLVIDTRSSQQSSEADQVTETPTVIQHHSADALEGLQALAEQAGLIDNIIEEQVPVVSEQQTVDIVEQTDPAAGGTTTHTLADGTIIISAGDNPVVETITGEQIHYMVDSGAEMTEQASVEVTEDQLSSLQAGDIVEMDGELYLVEMAQDPNNPDKQLLSFLPVNTAN